MTTAPPQAPSKPATRKPKTLAGWSTHKAQDPTYRWVTLTCADFSTAQALDAIGLDMLLVGDSLAMTMLGHPNTLSITVDEMLHHVKAVTRGAPQTPVVADMPFLSYGVDLTSSIANAGRFIQEGHAQGVKIEGASPMILELIQRLTDLGIPVMAHVGMTPQHVNQYGGFKLQGKSRDAAVQVLKDAKAVQDAGAFAIVLELIPSELAQFISQHLTIPTIGIGAGQGCDGQILVIDDVLGRFEGFSPKFARQYAQVSQTISQAAQAYQADVTTGAFPSTHEAFYVATDLAPELRLALSDAWALLQ